jgi:hypothetical protein
METLALIIGSLALAAGVGLVIVALLHLESKEREGYVSRGWVSENGTEREEAARWMSK